MRGATLFATLKGGDEQWELREKRQKSGRRRIQVFPLHSNVESSVGRRCLADEVVSR